MENKLIKIEVSFLPNSTDVEEEQLIKQIGDYLSGEFPLSDITILRSTELENNQVY